MNSRGEFFKKFDFISNNLTENICVYYKSNSTSSLGITYFELRRVSCELSEYFLSIFGGDSQYLGVSLSDYCFIPVIILAVWRSGNRFAGTGDQYPKKNTLHFLNFLRVRYLITDKENINGGLISSFNIQNQTFFIYKRELPSKIVTNSISGDVCYGIMTSGSTGEPKIIQVPWSCILPNAVELSVEFQINESDCIFQASPYSFDPFFIELFMTLITGCTLFIVSNSLKLNASNLLKILFDDTKDASPSSSCTSQENYFPVEIKTVKKKKVSVMQITPSCFKRWSHKEIQNFILSPKASLRVLALGGEKFPKEVLKLRHSLNTTRIFNIYGITEISCWAFINEVSNCLSDEVSLGKPLCGIVYKISEKNEFLIGSNARICYIDEETVSHSGETVFRNTGDVVELVDEELYYIWRSDHIVKKLGMKINLSRIEDLFKNKCKFIKDCYCIYDEDHLVLGLFFEPSEGESSQCDILTYEDLRHRNYEIPLSELKDVEKPDYYFELKEIPLNSHGKCDRKKLLQELRSCSLQKSELKLKSFFKTLWTNSLGVVKLDLFSLGFNELGGTSVAALDIINKLEDAGFNVPHYFINELLGGKNYFECLRSLSAVVENCDAPQKKLKYDASSDVRLAFKWKFSLGKCVDATPAVFTFQGGERIVIGSHSSQLTCFNSESGAELWSRHLGGRIESGFRPTKDGCRGFIGCYDHFVYCLSSEDGSVIWKFKTGDMIKSTPCLSTDEKTVYVGSYDKHLYCLCADSGAPKKSLKLSNGSIYSSGVVDLENFYVGTLDGSCAAIKQETNQILWKVALKSPVFANPCLIAHKNEILFSEVLGNVHCLNAVNGVKMWTFTASGNIYSSPIVQGSSILFGCHDTHLYCLQYGEEVKLQWKQQLDSQVFARPASVSECTVCAATIKGVVYLCDSASGLLKSCVDLGGEVFSSPVVFNNRVFIGCRDNNVYAIDIFKL